jgi:hypothetical protein
MMHVPSAVVGWYLAPLPITPLLISDRCRLDLLLLSNRRFTGLVLPTHHGEVSQVQNVLTAGCRRDCHTRYPDMSQKRLQASGYLCHGSSRLSHRDQAR